MIVNDILMTISIISIMICSRFAYCQYSLYWTDIVNENDLQIQYYCLYRYESVSVDVSQRVHEIVPYCFRSKNGQEQSLNKSLVHGNSTTFGDLKMNGITSEQLYSWQASIDLIERYELYLANPNRFSHEQKFYNCTPPWFGLFCELSFNVSTEFSQLIRTMSSSKLGIENGDVEQVTNYTCYEHIECNRGPEPICLDWREICDGKVVAHIIY